VDRGIYKQGENNWVDNLVFKQKKELKENKNFPVTDVYGKKLKAPRSYKDVRGLVISDYQTEMEKQWLEQLRKKFSVEVYDDVVKTVNKH
jgi:peptidyl-prolyl cis-trans isomerase SurA